MNILPAMTTDLYLGYPYYEHTDIDTNLPNQYYEQLYHMVMMNLINRDLWIVSKANNKGAFYDEGQLLTLKVDHIEEDMKDQVGNYFIGEDMYLDPGFFTALGALAD